MSRLEEGKKSEVEELQNEIAKLKKGLKRKSNKKLLSCSNCLVVGIILLFIVFILVCYLLAISGLKNIPVLTAHFYEQPQPSYLVESVNLSAKEMDILAFLKNEIQQTFFQTQKTSDFTVPIDLSEEFLTEKIRTEINSNTSLKQKIDYFQIAVLPEYIEVYLKTPKDVVLLMNIVPEMKNEKIDLDVISFQIGNLKLPDFIGEWSIAWAAEKVINQSLNFISEFGKVTKINLNQGKVILEVFVNKFNIFQ